MEKHTDILPYKWFKKAPKWANYIAMDEDGEVVCSDKKLRHNKELWYAPTNARLKTLGNMRGFTGDWKKSLIVRNTFVEETEEEEE